MSDGDLHLPDVRDVGEGLHLLETEVEAFDVRSAVLVGRRRAVVWDTLAHPRQMAPVADLVGDLPVTVVYSHADWDHAWGTAGVRGGAVGAKGGEAGLEGIVGHVAAQARFRADVPGELAARRRLHPGVWDAVRLAPPTVTFDDTLVLELGGLTLELHALPGHTPDCIVGFIPETGVLLAGDTVETPLPVVNHGASVPGWLRGLERWLDDARVTRVVPSHGRVGGRDVIAETAAYLRGLLAGTAPDPGAVAPFYRDTHAANLRAVAEAEGASG